MKIKKSIIKFIIPIAVMATLIAVCITCWSPFALAKSNNRPSSYLLDQNLKSQIASETMNMTGEEIREYSCKKTARLLSFTAKNDIVHGKANCVGYAQLYAGICNYACQVNGLDCTAKPVVGYIMFYNINLCNALTKCMPNKHWKNFVKDHDFVEFHMNNSIIYSDACLYDLIGTDCMTIKE